MLRKQPFFNIIENMISEEYRGYTLTPVPVSRADGRWSVAVKISPPSGKTGLEEILYADDNIRYILKIEAEKECINFGKNCIRNNLIRRK